MTTTDAQPAADSVEPSKASRVKLPKEPRKILVADDEHLVATGVAAHLGALGYNVMGPASDGDEAIEMVKVDRPDLALLDIRMPGKDGLTTTEILSRQMHVPVVVFSAYSDPDYISVANRAGIFGYLLKPVTQDQLRVCIAVAWARYLEHHAQATEIQTLKERLENRKFIEQAKWMIVQRKGISEPDAMKLLQRHARNNRRTLVEVARSVIENADLFNV